MEPQTSGDRRVAGMNKWMVGLTVGTWAIVFIMTAVRYVNTGRMSHTSIFIVLVGVSCLLSLASHVLQRPGARGLLRSGAAAVIAVAAYVYFRGAR